MLRTIEILVGERLQMFALHKLGTGRIIFGQFEKRSAGEFRLQGLTGRFQLGADFFADFCLLLEKVGIRQQRSFFIGEREAVIHAEPFSGTFSFLVCLERGDGQRIVPTTLGAADDSKIFEHIHLAQR